MCCLNTQLIVYVRTTAAEVMGVDAAAVVVEEEIAGETAVGVGVGAGAGAPPTEAPSEIAAIASASSDSSSTVTPMDYR